MPALSIRCNWKAHKKAVYLLSAACNATMLFWVRRPPKSGRRTSLRPFRLVKASHSTARHTNLVLVSKPVDTRNVLVWPGNNHAACIRIDAIAFICPSEAIMSGRLIRKYSIECCMSELA